MAPYYSINQSLFLPTTRFSTHTLTTTTKKKSRHLIYKPTKTIQKTLEQNHVKKGKKHFKLCNRLSKFFEEARISRLIWNFTMS